MARTEININKAFTRNDSSEAVLNSALFKAIDATGGAAVLLDAKDEHTVFVAQNTATSAGTLTVLKGNGTCAAVDLKLEIPAASTVCFSLDSACFKVVSGTDKGKVLMTGPATICVAVFSAP